MRWRGLHEGGSPLLEMMVAIAVLAIAMTAIMSAQQASMQGSVLIKRGQAAALLMRSIIFDIEEEYKLEGFPENALEDRDCDVPEPFDDLYKCRYDLKRLDLEPEQMQALVDQSFGGLMGEGGLASLQAGDREGVSGTMQGLMSGSSSGPGGLDLSGLAFLMPFLGPEGEALMSLCNVNLGAMIMGFMGIQSFVPKVLEEVSNKTRQLTVTLSWNEGAFGAREFAVVTFITSLPEEQLQQLKEIEDAQEVLGGAGLIPDPSGGDDRGGGGGGGGGDRGGGSSGGGR
ncbi:MAG: type II secretion system protein [Deltaproteobacteria bacterium]|nr:type II secretion system protein [Deltaproteobacteria bacterium]